MRLAPQRPWEIAQEVARMLIESYIEFGDTLLEVIMPEVILRNIKYL